MKLKIRRFPMNEVLRKKPGSIILLLGKRGSGKSCMMIEIAKQLYEAGNIDIAVGMSPTDESNKTLSSFLPQTLIYPEFKESIVEKIMQQQKKQIKEKGPEGAKRVFLFLDDCGYDSKLIFNSKVMKRLFYNGRHSKIGLVMALQYAIDMPVSFRANCDICITMRETIYSNRERLYKQYFGQFSSMKSFGMAMDACTADYSSLVSCTNLHNNSNELTDSVFWYKAKIDHEPFILGSSAVKRMDRQCYDDVEAQIEEEKKKREAELNRSEVNRVVRGDEDGKTAKLR